MQCAAARDREPRYRQSGADIRVGSARGGAHPRPSTAAHRRGVEPLQGTARLECVYGRRGRHCGRDARGAGGAAGRRPRALTAHLGRAAGRTREGARGTRAQE
eukprot:6250136-Prymnesium_polylepis.1